MSNDRTATNFESLKSTIRSLREPDNNPGGDQKSDNVFPKEADSLIEKIRLPVETTLRDKIQNRISGKAGRDVMSKFSDLQFHSLLANAVELSSVPSVRDQIELA